MDGARRLALALFWCALSWCALSSASYAAEPILDCTARGPVTPLCGFQNPEDLAVVGDGAALIVSEAGGMLASEARGRISLFDPEGEVRRVVYPRQESQRRAPTPGWGDPACPGEPDGSLTSGGR